MGTSIAELDSGGVMKGLIGVQLHVGAPMKVEFRNIYLKNLR